MFRTELSVTPSNDTIGISTPLLTIGSCFSDTIGKQFQLNKFDALSNPFGTVYNPTSIFKLLTYGIDRQFPDSHTYLKDEDLYFNYDFHSSFSASNEGLLKQHIEKSISEVHEFLKRSQYLIITFGTAHVYELIENKEVVANCHKQPSKLFSKRLLTQKEILVDFDHFYENLKRHFPQIKIIVTVSPVRHIKDTMEGNSVSKATLRIACNTFCEQYKNTSYFPSYELLLDDLRDYRFFKKDMIHPNEEAEEYIWRKFQEAYLEKPTQKFIQEWSKIRLAINHKPLNPKSEKHQRFLKSTIQKINSLDQSLDFKTEVEELRKQLI